MAILFVRFCARRAGPGRAPLLERMLARADGRQRVADWRSHAYRLLAPAAVPPPGPAAVCAAAGAVDAAWAYLATAVHHTAGMSSVSLSAGAILRLDHDAAAALALDFNRVFAGAGLRLLASAPPAAAALHLLCDAPLRATTRDPAEAVEGDLWEFQPSGEDAARLLALMSEIEMWLFDHPVNRARAARGAAPITGLWLWGGGATLAALPPVRGFTAGQDPLFSALAGAAGSTPTGNGTGVVVLDEVPGTPAWSLAESTWLAPAAAQLRAGRIANLELSADDQLFRLGPRWQWRAWRKTRPWWEQLQS